MSRVIALLHETLDRNEPVILATVVKVKGASRAQVGFKPLVRADGNVVGDVGGAIPSTCDTVGRLLRMRG